MVGDVAGKGLQAAMLVASVIGSLRNEFSRAPGEVLTHLNRSLVGRTGGGFVTCCAALFHPDGRIEIANAGHIPPYLHEREIEVEPGPPLGIIPGVSYESTTIATRGPLTFLSDGVVEAANAKGELFGFERTAALTANPANQIAQTARQWGQNDDITVVQVNYV